MVRPYMTAGAVIVSIDTVLEPDTVEPKAVLFLKFDDGWDEAQYEKALEEICEVVWAKKGKA